MKRQTFEDAVEAMLIPAYEAAFKRQPSEKWLTAISMRVGTRGDVATLDEAGREIGVTRERVRQVMAKLEPQLHGISIPKARQVAESLVAESPVPEPVGRLLAAYGLTRPTLTGRAFLNILRLTGTSPARLVGTDLVSVDNWLVTESQARVMKAVSIANRHTSSYGMTTVEEIRQALASSGDPLDATDIRRVLEQDASIKWAGEWLWAQKDHDGLQANRLVNTARSILSVNSPQTVASIHEGARRMWKFRKLDILPSIAAMKVFFEESPYFIVEGDLVRPIEPLDYHDVLGTTTAAMIDVLKGSPYQVMDRQSLAEACDDAGIPSGTYTVWTTYAEWMERFGPNVWGLRGSSPNPAAVEAIRKAARARLRAEPRRKSWAWTHDGRIEQTMDVTTSFVTTGVMTFASAIRSSLPAGSLEATLSGRRVATVKMGEGHSFCWGWHPAITALGAKPGDVLRISIDVARKTAELQLGGQELWD
jgi:hypothetical protein